MDAIHRLPVPVAATLSYESIGGVRHASFEGGLLFIETVTKWEPGVSIGFTIEADTANIPPATLDEHVTIGGRYFDVLGGLYVIEPLRTGDVLIHLSWSDAVMRNIQQDILQVIKQRCEGH